MTKCEDCLNDVPYAVEASRPRAWTPQLGSCYQMRRNRFLNIHQKKCPLNLTVGENLEKTFDAVCVQACGTTIESRRQFEECFKKRCPVAIKAEHSQFAANMNFQTYLDQQFRQLNAAKFLEETLHLIRHVRIEEVS